MSVHTAAPVDRAPRPGLARRLALAGLDAYKHWLSPLLPPRCRFWPTCSDYARAAVARRGVVRGGLLAAHRLLRCHPFHPGGIDLPPE
jgi:putative membrane protein insertion efficiency factor